VNSTGCQVSGHKKFYLFNPIESHLVCPTSLNSTTAADPNTQSGKDEIELLLDGDGEDEGDDEETKGEGEDEALAEEDMSIDDLGLDDIEGLGVSDTEIVAKKKRDGTDDDDTGDLNPNEAIIPNFSPVNTNQPNLTMCPGFARAKV
jgi:hypothetical protein